MTGSERIDIALGFDDPYVPHAAAVIASVVANAPGAQFRFLVLHTGIPDARRRELASVAPRASFLWIEVNDEDLPEFGEREHLGHVNKTTFLRLGLQILAPADCRRVIYLDCDVVVLGDIRGLWRTDLGEFAVGAVPDTFAEATTFAERWNLPPQALGYFNAGVLLIDLALVRQEKLFTRALTFIIEKNPGFADQDALNYVCWRAWHRLDLSWNVQRDMLIPSLAEGLDPGLRLAGARPQLLHFTGSDKPWRVAGYHPLSWKYWKYLRKTPFFQEIVRREHMPVRQLLRLWIRSLVR